MTARRRIAGAATGLGILTGSVIGAALSTYAMTWRLLRNHPKYGRPPKETS